MNLNRPAYVGLRLRVAQGLQGTKNEGRTIYTRGSPRLKIIVAKLAIGHHFL